MAENNFTANGKPLIYGQDVTTPIPNPIDGVVSDANAKLISEREGRGEQEYDRESTPSIYASKYYTRTASNDQKEEIRDKKIIDADSYESFALVEEIQSIQVGEQKKLVITTTPITANYPDVTWMCETVPGTVDEDENPTEGKAYVSEDGLLTGVSVGTVKVTGVDTHKSGNIVTASGANFNAIQFNVNVVPAAVVPATPKEVDHTEEVVSYSTITISKFTYNDIPAAGGEVSPQVTYKQTKTTKTVTHYTDNTSKVTATKTENITSGATMTYEGTSVNRTTGVVSAKSTDVTTRTKVDTVTITVSLNGKTKTKTVDVFQAAAKEVTEVSRTTEVTYGNITIGSFSYNTVTPAGGKATPTVTYSQVKTSTDHVTYSNGNTEDIPTTTTVTTGATLAFSDTKNLVNANTGVATIPAGESSNTPVTVVTVTVTLNGKTATETANILQQN